MRAPCGTRRPGRRRANSADGRAGRARALVRLRHEAVDRHVARRRRQSDAHRPGSGAATTWQPNLELRAVAFASVCGGGSGGVARAARVSRHVLLESGKERMKLQSFVYVHKSTSIVA
eukprot:IDg1123t1